MCPNLLADGAAIGSADYGLLWNDNEYDAQQLTNDFVLRASKANLSSACGHYSVW